MNIEFCEEKYKITNYIAEYYNTTSNIYYLLPLLTPGANRNVAKASAIVGIGSAIFHATNTYYGELIDETAIIYLLSIISYYTVPLKYIFIIFINAIHILYVFTNIFAIYDFLVIMTVMVIFTSSYFRQINIRNSVICMILGKMCWLIEQSGDKLISCDSVAEFHPIWHLLSAFAITDLSTRI